MKVIHPGGNKTLQWKCYRQEPRQGLSHVKRKIPCQDYALAEENQSVALAVVADGLGEKAHSEIAAQAAVQAVRNYFLKSNTESEAREIFSPEALKSPLLKCVRENISDAAKKQNIGMSEMDCTLLFAVVYKKEKRCILGQIGDGAIFSFFPNSAEKHSICAGKIQSALFTQTVLSEQAQDYFSVWSGELEDRIGFLLTSDGLEKEIYLRKEIKKQAQWYYNLISSKSVEVCAEEIGKRLDMLTSKEDYGFLDDISLAGIALEGQTVELPEDPSWLCICGARNRLQDTYCKNCDMDFLMLYKNVDFQKQGKTEFFRELNKHADQEEEILKSFRQKLQAKGTGTGHKEPSSALILVHEPKTKKGQGETLWDDDWIAAERSSIINVRIPQQKNEQKPTEEVQPEDVKSPRQIKTDSALQNSKQPAAPAPGKNVNLESKKPTHQAAAQADLQNRKQPKQPAVPALGEKANPASEEPTQQAVAQAGPQKSTHQKQPASAERGRKSVFGNQKGKYHAGSMIGFHALKKDEKANKAAQNKTQSQKQKSKKKHINFGWVALLLLLIINLVLTMNFLGERKKNHRLEMQNKEQAVWIEEQDKRIEEQETLLEEQKALLEEMEAHIKEQDAQILELEQKANQPGSLLPENVQPYPFLEAPE